MKTIMGAWDRQVKQIKREEENGFDSKRER